MLSRENLCKDYTGTPNSGYLGETPDCDKTHLVLITLQENKIEELVTGQL